MEKILKSERLEVVDALRGFALMGIAIVHFMEQYVGGPVPKEHGNYTQHIFADGILEGVVNFLLRGKLSNIFSIFAPNIIEQYEALRTFTTTSQTVGRSDFIE